MEYRALVMEQMSHESEQDYLKQHPDPLSRSDGYGVVLLNYCLRDLNGNNIYLLYTIFNYQEMILLMFIYRTVYLKHDFMNRLDIINIITL